MKYAKIPLLFSIFTFLAYFAISIGVADAQSNNTEESRKLSARDIAKVTDGNTIWKRGTFDRLYFQHDKKLVQQINDGWNNLPAGTIFTGKWNIKNNNLCWTYDQETQSKHKLPGKEICFDIYTTDPEEGFMTHHNEKLFFKPAGSGPNGPNIFSFSQWVYNNHVIDPEYIQGILKAMQTAASYRSEHGGAMPGGTIKREEMNANMQNYYDAMINKIFFIVRDYMFFDDNGRYYWISANSITEANGDVKEMMKKVRVGRWNIKGNIKCWYLHARASSCEYVLPEGKGLTREFDGILGIHHSTFTRIHGEGGAGHMDPEDSESPELYEYLQKMYK